MGPLGPDGLDLATSSDLGRQVRGGAAIAHNLLVGDSQGGVVVGPLTLNGLWGSSWREASVPKRESDTGEEALVTRRIPRIGDSINNIARHCAMGGSLCHKEGSGGVDGREEHSELI